MKKYFKVEYESNKEIVGYSYEVKEEKAFLILTKQEYKFIHKLNTLTFPQSFVDQNNGIEYKMYDVNEIDGQVVAVYEQAENE